MNLIGEAGKLQKCIKLQTSCYINKIVTSNDSNLVTSKKPGTVLLMQNVDHGHTKVMQIRQRETLCHQRAKIHEKYCSAAQYVLRLKLQYVCCSKHKQPVPTKWVVDRLSQFICSSVIQLSRFIQYFGRF